MSDEQQQSEAQEFEGLLEYLKRTRGFDLTGYKQPGLMRRVQKRMGVVGIGDFAAYQDYLEVHPDEFGNLFNTILINVTSFFRDPGVWEYVRQEVVPRLLSARGADGPVRVWSAGCATGEEAYTLAMVFGEAMGVEEACRRVKIYATDVDEEALNAARQASYTEQQVAGVPAELLGRYFDKASGAERYTFNKDLRRCVIFGRHDLLQDAPISRVDLLVCRNTLMYFNAEAQTRILTRFLFALSDDGFLLLGKAETLLTRANLFTPADLRRRVFAKVPKLDLRDRLMILAQNGGYEGPGVLLPAAAHERLREAAFDAGAVAQVIVDADGTLAMANERARVMFNVSARDVGRPLSDMELSYRPVELRSVIERVYAEHRPVSLKEAEWVPAGSNGERLFLDIQVVPLQDGMGAALGVAVTFTDVTRQHRLNEDLQRSHQELEAAYEELQSTSEELETTNEELQSTVEELETTNEELQSTNEELETMNEELQSTNEELQTINDELRQRTDDLNQVNSFMNSILTSLRTAVVVVDREMRVQAWNQRAEDLWGLRQEEVQGKQLMGLDIGLPVDRLVGPIREAMGADGVDGFKEVAMEATNRRGRGIRCKVTFTPLRGAGEESRGVILLMEEVGKEGDGRVNGGVVSG